MCIGKVNGQEKRANEDLTVADFCIFCLKTLVGIQPIGYTDFQVSTIAVSRIPKTVDILPSLRILKIEAKIQHM